MSHQEFFNRIKNNDYDCIFMTHDQFAMIPQSSEIQQAIIEEELSEIDASIESLKRSGGKTSKRTITGLQKKKENKEARMQELFADINERKVHGIVDFSQLGIDHIFVDESHKFKNLSFSTKHTRVSGLGSQQDVQRSFNLLTALRTLQRDAGTDMCATFLSGTTISNSLTELYSLFKYLRPNALEEQGIRTFDAWAAVFAKKSVDFEISVTGEIIQKERFRSFIKIPELSNFLSEITDYKTAEDVGIDRPKKKEIFVNLQPTEDQKAFTQNLIAYANTGAGHLIGREGNDDTARMLLATNASRKMSLDMRMIDEAYSDNENNKLSECAKPITKLYYQFDKEKGTQFVFSDIGVWHNNTDWTAMGELKRKLVEDYNIPKEEVRFIQEVGNSDNRKSKMIEDINKGKIRVVIGSTEMLGTGVNAQSRAVAVHHLDVPWKPSDLEQRDGRAIRKGNEVAKLHNNNEVLVYMYGTENSLDAYQYDLLKAKQTFICQIKNSNCPRRSFDESNLDETGMALAEYTAILQGNTDLLDLARVKKDISILESEKRGFYKEKDDARLRYEDVACKVERQENLLEAIKSDYDKFQNSLEYDTNGKVINKLFLNGLERETDVKVLGAFLQKLNEEVNTNGEFKQIGSIYGFSIKMKSISEITEDKEIDSLGLFLKNKFYVQGTNYLYEHNNGNLATDSKLACESFLKALEKLPNVIDNKTQLIDKLKGDLSHQASLLIAEEWDGNNKLLELIDKKELLERKINTDLENNKYDVSSVVKEKNFEDSSQSFSQVEILNQAEKNKKKVGFSL